jgi:predicted P-loop ATPase
MLRISVCRSVRAQPQPREYPTWEAFAAWLAVGTHEIIGKSGSKKDEEEAKTSAPAFVPATFSRPERKADAVKAVTILVLDVDGEEPARLDAALQKATDAGLDWLCYTTYSHGAPWKPGVCVRLLLPLPHELPPGACASSRQAVAQYLGLHCDSSTLDPSRLFFFPTCPQGREGLAYIRRSTARGALPATLLAQPPARAIDTTPANGERVITRDDLLALARKRWSYAENLKQIAKGERFTQANDKVRAKLLAITTRIVAEWPDCSPESVDGLFAASMALLEGDDRLRGNAVWPPGTVAEFIRSAKAKLPKTDAWQREVLATKEGTPKGTEGNVKILLEKYEPLKDLVAYNERAGEVFFLRTPPWGASPGDTLHDKDASEMTVTLLRQLRMDVSSDACWKALKSTGMQRRIDPVADYLTGLKWDGTPRVKDWLVTYAGAMDDFATLVGRKWLIGAVARALEPGCKMDCMLVLEGEQGIGKSTLFRVLAGDEWFTDRLGNVESKEAAEQIGGAWIVEVAELASVTRVKEVSAVKAFLSQVEDRYRPPYGRSVERRARRCVFAGTINPGGSGYLSDDTGNRRFWPVEVREIDIEAVRRDRDQLWAEAVHLYESGVTWHLSREEMPREQAATRARRTIDPWEDELRVRLEKHQGKLTMRDVLTTYLGIPVAQQTRAVEMRGGRALRALGYEKKTTGAFRYWVKVEEKGEKTPCYS